MVIFKFLIRIHNKNKNGSGSYSFSKDNYNAGKCGSGHYLGGNIPQGNPNYDAARANMGGTPWMMFTKTQGQELIDNTTSTWTTINGVNGYKFTNKTDDSKYIFISTPGYYLGTTHRYSGSEGYYWSTMLYSSYNTWYLCFNSANIYWNNDFRYNGMSIRPVAPQRPW